MEALIIRQLTPNVIKGHISNLKAFFRTAGFDTLLFESVQVANALRALDLTINHKPKPKTALEPHHIAKIITAIESFKYGKPVALSIALMFTGFLRQSNLLPRSVNTFDPLRQVTCADVTMTPQLLKIELKWSKTNQKFGESTVVTVSRMPDSTICPVSRYIQTQPLESRSSQSPLIRFPDGNPIPVAFVNKYWKAALDQVGIDKKYMTLHRLRLSGASWANSQGVAPLDICKHGLWKSDSFRAYVVQSKSNPNKVNMCMSKIPT